MPSAVRRELVDSIERATREVGDSRALRTRVLTRLATTLSFEWYAWVLTDPVTYVGIDPLADIPDVAEISRAVRLKYLTAVNRWTVLHSPALSLLQDVTPVLTTAIRRNRAASFAADSDAGNPHSGPAVLLLDEDLTIRGEALESEDWLRLLLPHPEGSRPIPACAFNVAAQLLAREAGVDAHEPMARMPLPSGAWATLRATRLEPSGQLAVTIERTTVADRLHLFGLTHGLTERERIIVAALATGDSTAELALRLHLSPYTVQDHLKSIFAKSGTHSRRALLARAVG